MNLVNLGPFKQYIPDSEDAVQFALYLQDKPGREHTFLTPIESRVMT